MLQSMWHAGDGSPGPAMQRSERLPQSPSWAHAEQCVGLRGMQYPFCEPAVIGSQNKLKYGAQSPILLHCTTHTLLPPATTGLQSWLWHSLSALQLSPGGLPGRMRSDGDVRSVTVPFRSCDVMLRSTTTPGRP